MAYPVVIQSPSFTQNPASLLLNNNPYAVPLSYGVGSGGVTAGYAVCLDANGNVVMTTTSSDSCVGIALTTQSSGSNLAVAVADNGSLVQTPFTLSESTSGTQNGGLVYLSNSVPGGLTTTAGTTVVGNLIQSATGASIVAVRLMYGTSL